MLNNEKKYSINKSTDLFFYTDFSSADLEKYKIHDNYFTGLSNYDDSVYFIVCLDGTYYTFSHSYRSIPGEEVVIEWGVPFERVYLKLVSSSGGSSDSSSAETVTVDGDYSITGAKDGSVISFNDGTWTFSYMSSSKTGSYSQSGNELTMSYTMGGYSVSAVFTVTEDGDNVKLTGKSGDYTTIVSSAFMVSDSDAITNGNVTLTAK